MSGAPAASPPRALIDAAGVEHRPADEPARIVSLVPSITELLFDLDLGPQIVGRTTFCVHPAEAVASVPRVGGTKTVNLDRLRALEPSHVILNIDENTREMAEAIRGFVPNVVVTHPLGPHDNLALYRLLGGLFDRADDAERWCGRFERAFTDLHTACAGSAPRSVLYLIWREPWMTVSRDTYVSRTLALVNWHTVAHDELIRYPQIAVDPALREAIDLVLLSSEPFPFKARHAGEIRESLGDEACPVRMIDGEMTSWYGSRAVQGLRYLREFAAGEAVELGGGITGS
ncbi:MAG: helical backbone metal receptor [Gammaproteobacteria bacterium]